MKKRVLSFLIACFMVVSTFIISKPLVHVRAVDGTSEQSAEPSVYGEWVFSGDATDYTKDNNFAVVMYKNYTGNSSGGYIATAVMPTLTPATLTKSDGWKYIPDDVTSAYISYKGTNSLGGISVNLAPINYNISIEFTAPSDGIYSFEEVVKQLENSSATQTQYRSYENLFAFIVLKGNTIYDSYVTKIGSSATTPSNGTLSGYVTLKKGEVLKFVVSEAFSNMDVYDKNWNLSIESLVVKKVADFAPKTDITETVYAPSFDGTSYTSNNFTLKGVYDSGTSYTLLNLTNLTVTEGTTDFTSVYHGATAFKQANGVLSFYNGTTKLSNGNLYGAAIVFTAPEDGTYMMNAFVVQAYMSASKNTSNTFAIVTSGYTPLDSINYSGAIGEKGTGATLNGLKAPLSATATLKAGETITLILDPDAADTQKGSSIYNLNVVKVTVPGHPGEAHTDEEGTMTADNESHSFNRECCDHTDYSANHTWENGVCTDPECGWECSHDWSNKDGVCANCGMTHDHTESSIGTTCNNDGTHTDYCAECGYVYGSENCKPMEGNLCRCGYDCSAMIAEDNFDEVFDSYYNGGETDYVANGPAAGAFDNVGAVKGADVDGFKYMGFNLEMSADKNTFYLRHHVLLSGDLAVKVGEADADLKPVSGNYYYFDVEVKVGEFGEAHTITADGTAVVTASVYSYMKTALESGELSAEQTNLLKALYDWDYAVANAN